MESRISHFVMLSYFDGALWNICFHLHVKNFLFNTYQPRQDNIQRIFLNRSRPLKQRFIKMESMLSAIATIDQSTFFNYLLLSIVFFFLSYL